jgi:hypothetical protein
MSTSTDSACDWEEVSSQTPLIARSHIFLGQDDKQIETVAYRHRRFEASDRLSMTERT